MSSFIDWMMDEETAESSMKTMQEGMASRARSNTLFYYYRKLDYDASSVVRFLPISTEVALSDEVRKRFSMPKKVIRLRFDNPEVAESKVVITIPVMQMYIGGKTENDLILKQVKALYDESDKLAKAGKDEAAKAVREKASYHWTRGEHLAQGFVVRSGFQESDPPENPIRVFELNKQIMNKINAKCDPKADPEMALRYWPVHGRLGTNFVIKKTRSGEWPSYNESDFANSTSQWTDVMKAAIGTYGLWDLEKLLPERPGDEEYKFLAYIVEQSIGGQTTWNPDWEAHLDVVKVYKTGTEESGINSTEATTASVRAAMARISGAPGTPSASKETIVTQTSDDTVIAAGEEGTRDAGDPEVDEPPVNAAAEPKSAHDVRSIVEQIKRTAKGKTATVDAEASV